MTDDYVARAMEQHANRDDIKQLQDDIRVLQTKAIVDLQERLHRLEVVVAYLEGRLNTAPEDSHDR